MNPLRQLALRAWAPHAGWAGLVTPIYKVFRLQCTQCGAPAADHRLCHRAVPSSAPSNISRSPEHDLEAGLRRRRIVAGCTRLFGLLHIYESGSKQIGHFGERGS